MLAEMLAPIPQIPFDRKIEINEKREQFRPVATRGVDAVSCRVVLRLRPFYLV